MLGLLTVLIASGMFGAAFVVGARLLRRVLRLQPRRPLARPRPAHWSGIVERNVPIAARLAPDERERLLAIAHSLVDTRHWEGCGGLELTEEIQVSIAAQAALLALGLGRDPYQRVDAILVYPSTFQPRRFSWTPSSDPVEPMATLGEAWHHGVVILSWDAARAGATNPFDGSNVVLHEFAHQLDAEDGAFDGIPLLENRSAYQPWSAMLQQEYEKLVKAEEQGQGTPLDYYGATNHPEFFAVATEAFFEKPAALKRERPDLYRELAGFYRQDPAGWPG